MALRQLEQAIEKIDTISARPHHYNMMKAYIDVMFYNFNWETMKHDDRKKAMSLINQALDKFNKLITWKDESSKR